MRRSILVLLLLGIAGYLTAQATVKLKLFTDEAITGHWIGMENDNYMIQVDRKTVLYIPQEMVSRVKIKAAVEAFPKYDQNKNRLFWEVSGEVNSNLGQGKHNLKKIGGKVAAGYDWNHQYALLVGLGFRNMNIAKAETFIPISVTPIKYFTGGRFLMFGGLELAYNFGIKNQWSSSTSQRPWFNTGPGWVQPTHDRGRGSSMTPHVGVRMVGKHGIDHVLSLGIHLQKFKSERVLEDDYYSKVDLLYKRWRMTYG